MVMNGYSNMSKWSELAAGRREGAKLGPFPCGPVSIA